MHTDMTHWHPAGRLLVANGADGYIRNDHGETPEDITCKGGQSGAWWAAVLEQEPEGSGVRERAREAGEGST